jgi:hypothetical protein
MFTPSGVQFGAATALPALNPLTANATTTTPIDDLTAELQRKPLFITGACEDATPCTLGTVHGTNRYARISDERELKDICPLGSGDDPRNEDSGERHACLLGRPRS